MKDRQFPMVTLGLILAVVLAVMGCENPETGGETTYTVWTDTATYSEFQTAFGRTLSDGYYIHFEFTSSQWNTLSPSLTNEGKHEWTESQLYDWFIGRGFGSSEANQERAWLLTIDHGFIASRTGSIVYMLLK